MKLLVVIDMQNDFIDGALGTPEAQAIVPHVVAKIREYRRDTNNIILFTKDTHFEDYLYTLEGKNLPVPHCIRGTNGWALNEQIQNQLDDSAKIIEKRTFGYQDWVNYLIEHFGYEVLSEVESIEVVGLCTDICVISNVMILKSIFDNIPITVDSKCCAGVTPQSHNNALEAMKMCQIQVD